MQYTQFSCASEVKLRAVGFNYDEAVEDGVFCPNLPVFTRDGFENEGNYDNNAASYTFRIVGNISSKSGGFAPLDTPGLHSGLLSPFGIIYPTLPEYLNKPLLPLRPETHHHPRNHVSSLTDNRQNHGCCRPNADSILVGELGE